jgi:hypothetical protein
VYLLPARHPTFQPYGKREWKSAGLVDSRRVGRWSLGVSSGPSSQRSRTPLAYVFSTRVGRREAGDGTPKLQGHPTCQRSTKMLQNLESTMPWLCPVGSGLSETDRHRCSVAPLAAQLSSAQLFSARPGVTSCEMPFVTPRLKPAPTTSASLPASACKGLGTTELYGEESLFSSRSDQFLFPAEGCLIYSCCRAHVLSLVSRPIHVASTWHSVHDIARHTHS